jgi:hypothetical protein
MTWHHPHDPDAPEEPEDDGLEEDFDPPEDPDDPSWMPLTDLEERYNRKFRGQYDTPKTTHTPQVP